MNGQEYAMRLVIFFITGWLIWYMIKIDLKEKGIIREKEKKDRYIPAAPVQNQKKRYLNQMKNRLELKHEIGIAELQALERSKESAGKSDQLLYDRKIKKKLDEIIDIEIKLQAIEETGKK